MKSINIRTEMTTGSWNQRKSLVTTESLVTHEGTI